VSEETATPQDRAARGKSARAKLPREDHATWEAPADRPDPIGLLEAQAVSRVPELIPIRYGRMLVSPFAFYRGAAAIMASDLASLPNSGIRVQLSGDAHLSNFGGFASPERDFVFDLNDFDETLPGPWECDVKRLAASFAIAGRERGFGAKERRRIVRSALRQYRDAMRSFARMSNLAIWYARLDVSEIAARWKKEATRKQLKTFRHELAKAHAKDSMRALGKLTHIVDGQRRIVSDPPLIVPVEELMPEGDRLELEDTIASGIRTYRRTLQGDRRHLLEEYRLVHLARKVVGVGSVGTRAWIALMMGLDEEDPLFLQFKEAQESALSPFVGKSTYANQGQRVVEGQLLIQAVSDIFLGWDRVLGPGGEHRDFYVRQLWDWKISADVESLSPSAMRIYGQACGWTLARAHARSGDRIAIAAYLGSGDAFDRAVAEFAEAYAEQNERDYEALGDAVKAGRLVAEEGI
jgi:uncharacterized protein (DUF2252 family)